MLEGLLLPVGPRCPEQGCDETACRRRWAFSSELGSHRPQAPTQENSGQPAESGLPGELCRRRAPGVVPGRPEQGACNLRVGL